MRIPCSEMSQRGLAVLLDPLKRIIALTVEPIGDSQGVTPSLKRRTPRVPKQGRLGGVAGARKKDRPGFAALIEGYGRTAPELKPLDFHGATDCLTSQHDSGDWAEARVGFSWRLLTHDQRVDGEDSKGDPESARRPTWRASWSGAAVGASQAYPRQA